MSLKYQHTGLVLESGIRRTIPLSLVTVSDNGKVTIDHKVVLDEREKFIPLDTSKPFKLNAGTVGVCASYYTRLPHRFFPNHFSSDRVLYTPERLAAIAKVAGEKNSPFSFEDRIGLINDAPALAKAGLTQTSSALTLIDNFRNETECKLPV